MIDMYCITAKYDKRVQLQDYMASRQQNSLKDLIQDIVEMIEQGNTGDEFTFLIGSTSVSIKKEAEPTDNPEPDYDNMARDMEDAEFI